MVFRFDPKLTMQQNEICMIMGEFRIPCLTEAVHNEFLHPYDPEEKAEDTVLRLLRAEKDRREQVRFDKILKGATLRYPDASFDESLKDPDRRLDTEKIDELSDGGWIQTRRNLIITGPTGGGKTYFANALCVSLLLKNISCRYCRVNRLIDDLLKAAADGTKAELIDSLTAYELLVIDDFGFFPIDDDNKCNCLFELIDSRDGQHSTVFISQYSVSEWYDRFTSEKYAESCINRMLDRAFRLEFNGKNMRMIH